MKKTLKLIVVFGVMLSGLLMVWAKAKRVEPTSSNEVIETQSQLYISNCARCHGADGKGNTKLGQEYGIPDLTTSRISSSKVKQIILKGDGDMPAFGKKLKASQVNSLVKSIRSLRR
jgi:mono/diheme cytochrome c family protein